MKCATGADWQGLMPMEGAKRIPFANIFCLYIKVNPVSKKKCGFCVKCNKEPNAKTRK